MYTHCINVCTLSTIMALRLKMSNKQIHNIAMGAILHDIGLRYINVPYVNVSENKMTNKDAIEYIKVHSGVKYDPTIASKFSDSVAAYPVGCTVYTSDDEKAVVIRQNNEAADRPVIRMTEHADGTPYSENIEYNLLKQLTMFIVDTE